ncbi:bestrophin-like domain [Actinokineospora xionganensis]|uniref:DUF4239 domain-containing protein n=1 Tax=Actinokineospora xionganensis TaxID=2684470 RepID=A0ABR7L5Z0_9PSEU|nr:hypothetical protein [Actinokineospora xionganensis]MBC6448002.1 hypothetical protein [Actinokineospora xionganensis]
MVVTVVAVLVALVAGLLANRFVRDRVVGPDAEGTTVRDLLSPLETLAVLVLAFVLVAASESFGEVEDAAGMEAKMVDHRFEVAEYAPAANRERIQADAVCYAKAVRSLQWPAMADGKSSSRPVWTADLRAAFKEMEIESAPFEMLVEADKERSSGRRQRLAESTPAIPDVVYWFMSVTLMVMAAAFAFSLPRRRNRAEIVTLTVLTALLTLSSCSSATSTGRSPG